MQVVPNMSIERRDGGEVWEQLGRKLDRGSNGSVTSRVLPHILPTRRLLVTVVEIVLEKEIGTMG
jgi:hypothetical protein